MFVSRMIVAKYTVPKLDEIFGAILFFGQNLDAKVYPYQTSSLNMFPYNTNIQQIFSGIYFPAILAFLLILTQFFIVFLL